MSRTIIVGWGQCAPMRNKDVLTALTPYGVRVRSLTIDVQPEGSIANVTVSDEAAAWAEYLLCRSGRFGLMSKPIDARNIEWGAKWHTLPVQRGCHTGHTQAGTVGEMPVPWSESKTKRQPRQRRNKRSRQHGGILDTLTRLFR